MGDRWIITTHKFMQHESFEKAQAEIARLQGEHPQKQFRLMRVKTTEERSNAQELIAELTAQLEALVGLAAMSPGKLHQYKAALDDARVVIAKVRGSKAEAA